MSSWHMLFKSLKLSTGACWVLVFSDSSAQIFESSWSLLNFDSGKVLAIKQHEESQQWPWIRAQCVSGRFVCSSVWGKQFVLKVTCQLFGSARPEWITCFISSFETQWQAFTSSGECTKCTWVEFSPWKQAKFRIPKRSASPQSTWPSCSPTVRRAFADSLGMTSDDVTRHPGKLTLRGFKSSCLTLEPWTIYGEHEVDRFKNSRRHRQLRGRLCCNIFSLNVSS